MKKNSIIALVIGLLILAGLVYFLNKPKPQPQNSQPFEIVVKYNKDHPAMPQSYRVEEGQQIVLKITSDIADELHLHGYDLHIDLEEGKEGQIAFTADKTGRFEFELEEHKITLGAIEVNPK